MATPAKAMTTSSVASDWPELTGRQQPHHLHVSPGDESLGDEAITLASRLKTDLMPWQQDVVRAVDSRDGGERWTHTDCVLICPRQNGKSLILSVLIVHRLFLRGEKIIFTAQQWRTAEAIYKRTWEMVRRSRTLKAKVTRTTCSQGRGTIELASGAEVTFTTRSTDAGRGLDDVDLLVYDEAYNLSDGEVAALGFTQLAARDPQTIYTSSAVNQDQHAYGWELAALRTRGLEDEDPQLYFAEFMAPEEMDRSDPLTWAYANPSYGVIQTEDKVRKMMRSMSTVEGRKAFDVEALGRGDWPVEELAEDVEPVFTAAAWSALFDGDARRAGQSCLAVHMSASRDERVASIVVATETKTGRPHVRLGYHGPAVVSEVVDFISRTVEAFDPVAVLVDPKSSAHVLIQPLVDREIEPTKLTWSEVQQATAGILAAVDEQAFTHDDDPRMWEAIESAQLRDIGDGGGVAWDQKKSGPISQLIAATNALWGLRRFKPEDDTPPPAVGFIPNSSTVGGSLTAGIMEAAW